MQYKSSMLNNVEKGEMDCLSQNRQIKYNLKRGIKIERGLKNDRS